MSEPVHYMPIFPFLLSLFLFALLLVSVLSCSANAACLWCCRKIVAWSALQFPWKDRPLDEQEKAMATSHDMPPLLPGMNSEGMAEFFASLNCTLAYDYDPEKDYREFCDLCFPCSLPT